jgi:hypothetical protein
MPYIRTPMGITPPAPGLDREEPEFVPVEEDIPCADAGSSARTERHAKREEGPLHKSERE